jgi:hypothetical protein
MKVEQQLKTLKGSYARLKPSSLMAQSGWDVLRQRIEREDMNSVFVRRVVRYAALTAVLVLVLSAASAGVVVASFRTSPGDFLYPVKVFSEKVSSRIAIQPQELNVVTPTATPTDAPEVTPEQTPSRTVPTEIREVAKPAQLPEKAADKAQQRVEETVQNAVEQVQQILPVEIKIPSL